MFIIILYKLINNNIDKNINTILSFGVFIKVLNGVKITKINPIKLLIKNRG